MRVGVEVDILSNYYYYVNESHERACSLICFNEPKTFLPMTNIGCIDDGLLRSKMVNTKEHICAWLFASSYIYNVPPHVFPYHSWPSITFFAFPYHSPYRHGIRVSSFSLHHPRRCLPPRPPVVAGNSVHVCSSSCFHIHSRHIHSLHLQSSLFTGPTPIWTDSITAAGKQISCSTSWLRCRCLVLWSTLLSSSSGRRVSWPHHCRRGSVRDECYSLGRFDYFI